MSGHEIVIPGVERMLLTANQRFHWAEKARRVAYWRDLARVTALGARHAAGLPAPALQRAHVLAVITWPTNHRRDVSNWHPTIKACVDGIADAGWLPDDNDRHVIGPDLRRGHGPFAITVTLTPP